uniref:Uncharacterized protein n=1 Tax=Pristionchus pacificus TaxID=54126 RepID=A0A2A6BZM3_PRIPA|eukprot:PDM71277.1 hypothetical protein PRIPAC_37684 [Pristionchus pacificus]
MFRPNAPETGRVALVQANDTVRSVVAPSPAPSTVSNFAPPPATLTPSIAIFMPVLTMGKS